MQFVLQEAGIALSFGKMSFETPALNARQNLPNFKMWSCRYIGSFYLNDA